MAFLPCLWRVKYRVPSVVPPVVGDGYRFITSLKPRYGG